MVCGVLDEKLQRIIVLRMYGILCILFLWISRHNGGETWDAHGKRIIMLLHPLVIYKAINVRTATNFLRNVSGL